MNSVAVKDPKAVFHPHSPYVDITCNKAPVKALIDSGCSYTLASAAQLTILFGPDWVHDLITTPVNLKSASGHGIEVLGVYKCVIQFGKLQIPHDLLVIDKGEIGEFYIGIDTIKQYDGVLSKDKFSLTYKGKTEVQPVEYFPYSTCIPSIQLIEDVVLMPRQRRIVHAKLSSSNLLAISKLEGKSVCISNEDLVDEEYFPYIGIDDSVTTVRKNGELLVSISNYDNEPILLKKEIFEVNVTVDNEDFDIANKDPSMSHDEIKQGVMNLITANTLPDPVNSVFDRKERHSIVFGSQTGELPQPYGIDLDQLPDDQEQELDLDPSKKEFAKKFELKDLDTPNLDPQQRTELLEVLGKFEPYFAQFEMDVGLCPVKQIKIETSGEPRAQRYRPVAIAIEEEVDKLIKAMLKYRIIEQSDSNWASNLVVVSRKNSQRVRLCNDLRELNKAIKNMPQIPIPHFEETYLKLQGAKWFCCIDLANAYWNVEIDPKYRDRTAFFAKGELYQYRRMPFGLASAPAILNELLSNILRGSDAVVYFDDIICCAKTWEGMLKTLETVLQKITVKGGFKFRVNKCQFGLNQDSEIQWLGSTICRDQIRMQKDKVQAIMEWKEPTSLKQLQSFLGICNFYRSHINRFAELAVPLYDLTKKPKDAPKGKLTKSQLASYFKWSPEAQKAFDAIKEAIRTAPALALPNKHLPFILTTDASTVALGGVLSQRHSTKVKGKSRKNGRIHQIRRYSDVYRLNRISRTSAKPRNRSSRVVLDKVLHGGDNPVGTKLIEKPET